MDNMDVNMVVRFPRTLRDVLDAHVRRDTHMNWSEFVRDAVREKLMREAPDLYESLVRKKKGEILPVKESSRHQDPIS